MSLVILDNWDNIYLVYVFVFVLYNEMRSVVFCKSWPFFFLAMSIIAVIRNGHCQKYWEKIHRGTLYNNNEIAVAENVFSRPFRNNSGWSDDIYHGDKLVIFSCFYSFSTLISLSRNLKNFLIFWIQARFHVDL